MKNKPIGLEYLIITEDEISISANARILNKNYSKGICINTIEQFRDVLKNNGIELHQEFVKESVLSLAHVKNDVDVEISDLKSDFSYIRPSKFFKIDRNNSITFESINKGDKMNVNIYGKYFEMNTNKSKYKGLNIEMGFYNGITRIESKFDDWRTVKKYLGTRNTIEILQQKNVNSIILNNILRGQPMETPKVDLSQLKTVSQFDDYARTKLLFELCNGNFHLMTEEIKQRLGKNTKPSYQVKKLKKYLPMIQNPQGKKLNSIIKLKEALKE